MAVVNLGSQSPYTIDENNAPPDNQVTLDLASSGTLIVDGVDVNISQVVGGGILSHTTIEAINGANVIVGSSASGVNVGSTMTYDIGANSSITLNSGTLNANLLNGTTINFDHTGGTGEFTLSPAAINLSLSSNPIITGLSNGDKIAVTGATAATLSGGVLTFTYPGALGLPTQVQFSVQGAPAGSTISFSSSTGVVTFACFLRGTRIATPDGEIAVEHLRPGDLVLTINRGKTAIKWVGRRLLDPKTIGQPRDALPIRICRDAIAESVPHRDLMLSPDHCLLLDGKLIPVKLLVNGTTIVQTSIEDPFEYFHIELEQHDVILAEGALAETYIDLGNRHMFGAPGVAQLFPRPTTKATEFCYPPVYGGAILERVFRRLVARAEYLGHHTRMAAAS